ncbi:MAG: hypothetical protein D6702_02160, partial [Planctomycetota bacterium]
DLRDRGQWLRRIDRVVLVGRGGSIPVGFGFGLELDLRSPLARAARLLDWKKLLALDLGGDGGLRLRLGLAEGQGLSLAAPSGTLRPDRWQHLALDVAAGRVALRVDGREVLAADFEGALAAPEAPPVLGDPGGDFSGWIDEFVLSSRVAEYGPDLRQGADLVLGAPRIVFGPDGLLDPTLGDGVRIDLVDTGERVGSFLVGRFAELEQEVEG